MYTPVTGNSAGTTREYRYERKFFVSGKTAREIEEELRFHPACLKEIYHERWVNNIYFDTLGFNNYYDNVEGDMERWKARIRWYGELFAEVTRPVLEFKIKKGLMGTKASYPLEPFTFDRNFNEHTVKNAIGKSKLDNRVADLVRSLKPTLVNCYRRKYFLSADKDFRVTIDSSLTFYAVSSLSNVFVNRVTDHNSVVVEVKYDKEAETAADTISSYLPFLLTKSSKYLQGLERVLM